MEIREKIEKTIAELKDSAEACLVEARIYHKYDVSVRLEFAADDMYRAAELLEEILEQLK